MKNNFALIRQIIALGIAFWGYSILFEIGNNSSAGYGLSRQLVEIFLLVMIFYGVFYVGKIFVCYWRNVDPKPEGKEIFIIGLFEFVYLPAVAIFFPLFIEDVFLNYKIERQASDTFLFGIIPFLIIFLFDIGGGIRNFIYTKNAEMRGRSLMKMEDILNSNSQKIKRGSLIHYYIGFIFIGGISFF